MIGFSIRDCQLYASKYGDGLTDEYRAYLKDRSRFPFNRCLYVHTRLLSRQAEYCSAIKFFTSNVFIHRERGKDVARFLKLLYRKSIFFFLYGYLYFFSHDNHLS